MHFKRTFAGFLVLFSQNFVTLSLNALKSFCFWKQRVRVRKEEWKKQPAWRNGGDERRVFFIM